MIKLRFFIQYDLHDRIVRPCYPLCFHADQDISFFQAVPSQQFIPVLNAYDRNAYFIFFRRKINWLGSNLHSGKGDHIFIADISECLCHQIKLFLIIISTNYHCFQDYRLHAVLQYKIHSIGGCIHTNLLVIPIFFRQLFLRTRHADNTGIYRLFHF